MIVLVVSEGRHEQSGALKSLLERLGGAGALFEFDRVSSSRIHAFHGKGKGYFKRAIRWLREAENRGANALILLIDEDGRRDRREQIQEAQGSLISQLPRAMGVAIRTFDAWILADEKTLTVVLGYTISKQGEPESIRDPKQVCADLLAKSGTRMAQSEMYARVAQRIDMHLLDARCRSGFKPFATYVRNIFR